MLRFPPAPTPLPSMPDSVRAAGGAQGDLWGGPSLPFLREASRSECQEAGHPFQMGGEDTCWGFYPTLSCVPFPLQLLSPALIKSHIYVSQVCTEPPSKHSAWARELGPTWPEASTTSFRPFLPSLPPFLQPLSSINEALRPLPFLHHRILLASSEPWGSLSPSKNSCRAPSGPPQLPVGT